MFYKSLKNKKVLVISLLLLLSISIVACGGLKTEAPITGIIWEWSGLTETEPASQSVIPSSENYTLVLSPDGSLSIKADCNMVMGTYTLAGNSLTIELGPSTMAFCGEQSLDTLYLQLLNNVASYTVENDQLVLELKEGAGKMLFSEG